MKRLHPLSGARRAVAGAVQGGFLGFFLALGLGGALDGVPVPLAAVFVPLGVLAGAGYAAARYLRFTYAFDGGTLSVASGVFDRQERDIPAGRIQNVDLERGVLHRALGLAVVRFETAGGSGTEAVLDAVTLDEARSLQEAVATRRREGRGRETGTEDGTAGEGAPDDEAGPGADEAAAGDRSDTGAPERVPLYELSLRDLVVLGLVSVRPSAPLLTVIGVPFLEDVAWLAVSAGSTLLGGPAVDSFPAVVALPPDRFALVAAVALVEFAVAAWLLSAAVTMASYYDFRLYRVGDDLRYERGLLGRYSGSIPLEKVQSVSVRENALMRRFGYAALSVETAGYGPGSNEGGAANTAVPLDDRATVAEYASVLGGVDDLSVERPPARARRRYAVRFAALPVALAAALFALHRFWTPIPFWYLALAGLLLAPLAGDLRWRNRGHALAERAFLARSGFWTRHTRVVPYYRVQTVVDARSVFQRYRDLASVTADTASTASLVGGDATAHDVDESTAREIHRSLRERLAADVRRTRGRGVRWRERHLPGERTGGDAGGGNDGASGPDASDGADAEGVTDADGAGPGDDADETREEGSDGTDAGDRG